jgi:uncharacterized membrane protein YdbT with pleckstrin-like domain
MPRKQFYSKKSDDGLKLLMGIFKLIGYLFVVIISLLTTLFKYINSQIQKRNK